MADRFKKDSNGNIVDLQTMKVIKHADGTVAKKATSGSGHQPKGEKPSAKKQTDKVAVQKYHTLLAKEILDLNQKEPIDPTNAEQIRARASWLFDKCIEYEITPTVPALINAWGFRDKDANKVLNGEFGGTDVKAVISEYMQALAQINEGSLLDSVSGQTGRIAEMNDRYGWTQTGGIQFTPKQNMGEILSETELKKLAAAIPQTQETDKPKAIDVEFEVVE